VWSVVREPAPDSRTPPCHRHVGPVLVLKDFDEVTLLELEGGAHRAAVHGVLRSSKRAKRGPRLMPLTLESRRQPQVHLHERTRLEGWNLEGDQTSDALCARAIR